MEKIHSFHGYQMTHNHDIKIILMKSENLGRLHETRQRCFSFKITSCSRNLFIHSNAINSISALTLIHNSKLIEINVSLRETYDLLSKHLLLVAQIKILTITIISFKISDLFCALPEMKCSGFFFNSPINMPF